MKLNLNQKIAAGLAAGFIAISGGLFAFDNGGSHPRESAHELLYGFHHKGGPTKNKAEEEAEEKEVTSGAFQNPEYESCSTKNCYRFEKAGYPGPNNTGPEDEGETKCSGYSEEPSEWTPASGTYEHFKQKGFITISNNNVIFKDACITATAGVSTSINIRPGATGFKISESIVKGGGRKASEGGLDKGIVNFNEGTSIKPEVIKVRLENCGECLGYTLNVKETYALANGRTTETIINCPNGKKETEIRCQHQEDYYGSDSSLIAEHDTLLNPTWNTSVILGDTQGGAGGPCDNIEVIENDLLAGGGSGVIAPCASSSSKGTSKVTIRKVRFARITCKEGEELWEGGKRCKGNRAGWNGEEYDEGQNGTGGYWPKGALFFLINGIYYTGTGQVWEGNFWDDSLESIPQP